jgi:hypothetical protein
VASERPRLVVAFDASGVSGASFAHTLGRARLRDFARVELAPEALTPSAAEKNLPRPDVVIEALLALKRRLGNATGATLVLPHGVASLALLDPPKDTGLRDFVRFRLARGLPYPAEEALVDWLALGAGRVLAAAVRRGVVAEYESAAAAAGLGHERVDLAPLMAAAGLRGRGAGVHVILGDAALSLLAFENARLAAFRTRRRDPGPREASWLVAEAERTASLAGSDRTITFSGAGAEGLVRELLAAGRPALLATAAPDPPAAAQAAWLSGVLA